MTIGQLTLTGDDPAVQVGERVTIQVDAIVSAISAKVVYAPMSGSQESPVALGTRTLEASVISVVWC